MTKFDDQDHPDRFTQHVPTTRAPEPLPDEEESRPHIFRWLLAGAIVLVILAVVFSSNLKRGADRVIAAYYQANAQRKLEEGDFAGALEELDLAVESLPNDPFLYYARGMHRYREKMYEQSLEDFSKVIELSPHFADGYRARGQVLMRLGRNREAIADYTVQIEETPPNRADPWNNRAYARALAKIELEEGLADVEKALEIEPDNSAYLDTRGYLHHLLGNDEAALSDLDRAVDQIAVERKETFQAAQKDREQGMSERLLAEIEQDFERQQAVIYRHRSLTNEALGNAEKAKADNTLAKDLGYDPETDGE